MRKTYQKAENSGPVPYPDGSGKMLNAGEVVTGEEWEPLAELGFVVAIDAAAPPPKPAKKQEPPKAAKPKPAKKKVKEPKKPVEEAAKEASAKEDKAKAAKAVTAKRGGMSVMEAARAAAASKGD